MLRRPGRGSGADTDSQTATEEQWRRISMRGGSYHIERFYKHPCDQNNWFTHSTKRVITADDVILPVYTVPSGTDLYRGGTGRRTHEDCLRGPMWLGDSSVAYAYCCQKFDGVGLDRPTDMTTQPLPKLCRFKTKTDMHLLALDECSGVNWLAERLAVNSKSSKDYIHYTLRGAFDCSEPGSIRPIRGANTREDRKVTEALCRLSELLEDHGLTAGYAAGTLSADPGLEDWLPRELAAEIYLCHPNRYLDPDDCIVGGVTCPKTVRRAGLTRMGLEDSDSDGTVTTTVNTVSDPDSESNEDTVSDSDTESTHTLWRQQQNRKRKRFPTT
jgi:hypothetical protein